MQEWFVRVECAAKVSRVQLQAMSAHVRGIEYANKWLVLDFYLAALSLRHAMNKGMDMAEALIGQAGVEGTPYAVHALTEGDYIRQLTEQSELNVDIVGVAEIQEILNVKSRQQVDQLKKRPDFPAPVKVLKCGHIWLRPHIERFGRNWNRRSG